MKILLIHNRYQQYGGEDAVVQLEHALLKKHGQDVVLYDRTNSELKTMSWPQKVRKALTLDWSKRSYRDVLKILKEFKPAVVHVHNTYGMITPSIYYACRESNIPVVQSLYNYRLLCANAVLLRNGRQCEECLHHSRWRSVFYRCHRNSAIQTALIVNIQNRHWKQNTWTQMIDAYITSNPYSRSKFIQAGIPADKFHIKPHFVSPDPLPRTTMSDYVFYVGRISIEKGVKVMLEAWESLPDIPLKVMGTGPLLDDLKRAVREKGMRHIEILGHLPDEELIKYLKGAKFVVIPSICHDNFPRTIIEAYACGVPVLASSLEGIKEFIVDKKAGRLFEAGDVKDLVAKARWLNEDEQRLFEIGRYVREEYEKNYTADKNYQYLMEIYEKVINASPSQLCVSAEN